MPQRQVSSEKVEHAIEEEPSEIYVKEELTLDIPFAVQVRATWNGFFLINYRMAE